MSTFNVITQYTASVCLAVTNVSVQSAVLALGDYRVVSSVDAFVAIGTNPTAAPGDGSHLLIAGGVVLMMIRLRDSTQRIAIIRAGSTSGLATFSRV